MPRVSQILIATVGMVSTKCRAVRSLRKTGPEIHEIPGHRKPGHRNHSLASQISESCLRAASIPKTYHNTTEGTRLYRIKVNMTEKEIENATELERR